MKHIFSQKGFALPIGIAVIALIIVVFGVGYFLTRPQSPVVPTAQIPIAEDKILADGTMVKADGTMVKPDGTIVKPDGTMIKVDGTMVKPDGTMIKLDGTIVKPEDVMIDKNEQAKPNEAAMIKFSGTVLAGTSSPVLDFNTADYNTALKSDKLVVLYFYANWCPLCKAEIPKLYAAFDSLTDDKVVAFRVSYKDSETDQAEKDLARQYGIAYQHTKVFVRNGQILKSPEIWDQARYIKEINFALAK